ncbi:hypothetical protein SCLCIDRAFT_214166 [Scleroderma citrinum Foug A]|uniref:Uncharacterized protein n=1 Tax=Scleroderma citrinum Foug A TaxID=1036808 RepID=A0A0C3A006_9AGAM|nr:hypothetical protein SCLCIDRAFT_214166 [Scleroderma citrinum Foug A]
MCECAIVLRGGRSLCGSSSGDFGRLIRNNFAFCFTADLVKLGLLCCQCKRPTRPRKAFHGWTALPYLETPCPPGKRSVE